jgi:hypothetical protein
VRRVDPLTKCRSSVCELSSIVHPFKVNSAPEEDGGWRTFRCSVRD